MRQSRSQQGRRSLSVLVAVAVLQASSLALATPAAGEQQGHVRFAVGAKASYLLGLPHGEAVHHVGGGPFFEATVVTGWLELEIGARLLGSSHGAVVPIDLLTKLPVHLSDTVHGFIGAGPTLVPAFAEGDSSLHAGLAAVLGAYFCLSHHWAIVGEVGYNLLREHGSTVHEVGFNGGAAYRF